MPSAARIILAWWQNSAATITAVGARGDPPPTSSCVRYEVDELQSLIAVRTGIRKDLGNQGRRRGRRNPP